jgi:hypothetical protein
MNQQPQEESMIDPANPAEWARQEPQASFIKTAERLQDQGYSIDALADSMLMIGLFMMRQLHGPQWLAARLVLLADKFHAEADQIRRASAEGDDGSPN